MRSIGSLQDEQQARLFGEYLYVKGIDNDVEAASNGTWEVWVHDEDQLDQATELLVRFQEKPDEKEVQAVASEADKKRRLEEEEQKKAATLYKTRDDLFTTYVGGGMGTVTMILIAVSVLVAIVSGLGSNIRPVRFLFLELPRVMDGQIWRIFTPIFLHFGLMHILFNMLWLKDLGGMVERYLGSRFLIAFVLVVAGLSNIAQVLHTGPMFGGMSGVVYGLLGFVWMKGKFDPFSKVYLHSTTVWMMGIWYFLCLFGLMGNIANTVHTVGLVAGIVWGFSHAKLKASGRLD